MRLPRAEVMDVGGERPLYTATVVVELWPGLRQKVYLTRLVRCPNAATCTRLERCGDGKTYVVTLYSSGAPFASVYLMPPWLLARSEGRHGPCPRALR